MLPQSLASGFAHWPLIVLLMKKSPASQKAFSLLKFFLGRFWDGGKKINKEGHQVSGRMAEL